MANLQIGEWFRGKKILDVVRLSNGWIVLKTENSKSAKDFRVKTLYQLTPSIRPYTPKHAHFAIDFYGKLCADKEAAQSVFHAIVEVWDGNAASEVLRKYEAHSRRLPGYPLEYIVHALGWILDQEDINFAGRPEERQRELDNLLREAGVKVPRHRLGSELAISLFCSIILGEHPVDAFMKANLDVLPVKRGRR